MSIGLAIFLSSIFLGLILLYNSTKDRWDWENIVRVVGKWSPPPICALVLGLILHDFYPWRPISSALISILICSLYFGPIYLYLSTKDQWDWRKIIWRMVKLALVVITVLGVGVTIYWYTEYLEERRVAQEAKEAEEPEEPQVQTEFWGLSLDSTKSDIRFLKGQPKEIKERTETDLERWSFHNGFGNTTDDNDMHVSFDDDDTIRDIYYWRTSGETQSAMDLYSIQGIRAGVSTSEDLLEKFGEPSLIRPLDSGEFRVYYFNQYDVLFLLVRNRVISLGITSQDRQEVEVKEYPESGDMESEP